MYVYKVLTAIYSAHFLFLLDNSPDDDGSFRRRSRRDDNQDYEPSRSEADTSWRRGGGGPPRGGGGFDDRRGGGGFDDRRGGGGFEDRRSGGGFEDRRGGGGFEDRRGGGGFEDRRGGGGFEDRKSGSGFEDRKSGGGFEDRKSGGGFEDRRGNVGGGFGGGRSNERGGFNERGGDRDSLFRGAAGGERPRLALQKRTAPMENKSSIGTKSKADPFGGATIVDTASKLNELEMKLKEARVNNDRKQNNDSQKDIVKEELSDAQDLANKDQKKGREPEVVNSRAALLESAPTVSRDSNNRRERSDKSDRTDRGPPLVVNKKFEVLADEEREKMREHGESNNRRERSEKSDRMDRGPPLVVNKKFEVLADEEREKMREHEGSRRDLGPPEPTNSRFAAAAQADRSTREDSSRGPPPTQNSRFAAIAKEERTERLPEPQGPPPTQNSRFAAAAAAAEREQSERQERRRDHDNFHGRGDGPPIPQNSRFAAVVAADDDYVPEERRRGPQSHDRFSDRDEGRFDDRRGGYGGNDDRRGGYGGSDNRRGGFDDRTGAFDGKMNRAGYDNRYDSRRDGGVTDILKPTDHPTNNNNLNPVELAHADNMFKIPEPKENIHSQNIPNNPTKKICGKESVQQRSETNNSLEVKSKDEQGENMAITQEKCLKEFVSGGKLGDELKQWLSDQGTCIPPVEKLVFQLLLENEQKNPDLECTWAEPSKYGAALLSLVEEDIYAQMQILWGIQKYCDKLGFPKLKDEYLVQTMYRAMYKFDLAGEEAFAEWKDDESNEHSNGKLKAVIQTVDWYSWLEEDDEEDDEEYYDSEE